MNILVSKYKHDEMKSPHFMRPKGKLEPLQRLTKQILQNKNRNIILKVNMGRIIASCLETALQARGAVLTQDYCLPLCNAIMKEN